MKNRYQRALNNEWVVIRGDRTSLEDVSIAVDDAGGQIVLRLGSRALVAHLSPAQESTLRTALPAGAKLVRPEEVNAQELDDRSAALGLESLKVRRTDSFVARKTARSRHAEPWDTPGMIAPEDDNLTHIHTHTEPVYQPAPEDSEVSAVLKTKALGAPVSATAVQRPLNERFINGVTVGVVIVSGKGTAAIPPDDQLRVVTEVQEGLVQLAALESKSKAHFDIAVSNVEVDIVPWAGARWPSLPPLYYRGFDAALQRDDNGKIYFFRGDEYVRISQVSEGADATYPKKIDLGFPKMPEHFKKDIDAAVMLDGRIYLFKDDEYVRFSNVDDGMDANYPKKIGASFTKMPAKFKEGIDAALLCKDTGHLIFFKGDEYVRFSKIENGMDPDFPQKLSALIKLPEGADDTTKTFGDGVDAAFWRNSNGAIYLFKKGRSSGHYVRLSELKKGIDASYPKPIGLSREEAEVAWRDPAMVALGYPKGSAGLAAYLADLRAKSDSPNVSMAFFTRHPTTWPGYAISYRAGEPSHIVMQLGATSDFNFDVIFAHETAHVFGAPDEYAASNCSCGDVTGHFFKVPNGNCITCATSLSFEAGPVETAKNWKGLDPDFEAGIDAAMKGSGKSVYFFKGEKYVRFSKVENGVDDGYPKTIATGFPGLPADFNAGIDAVLHDEKGHTYLFKKKKYARFSKLGGPVDPGYPKDIASNWGANLGVFEGDLDAAFAHDNGKIYFFQGSEYVRFSAPETKMDAGYPRNIAAGFADLPAAFNSGIDAAVMRPENGKLYLFKGDSYVRLIKGEACLMRENVYSLCDYTPWQLGWGAFLTGIDAAVTRFDNDKVYLFSKSKYLRYTDISAGRDKGYPTSIAGHWKGLPDVFENGIDAALCREDNGKLYFFKGGEYVRFSDVAKGVDAGYPQKIAANWKNLPADFTAGLDAASWLRPNDKNLLKQINALNLEIDTLQQDLKEAGPGQKASIAAEIKKLQAQIKELKAGKVYFFKGPDYVRFSNVADGVDFGYPKKIAASFKGMPESFNNGIDAVLQRSDNGAIYFFKGTKYIRISDLSVGMDPGYPKFIDATWMPFPR